VHAGTVVGADGFGFARRRDGWERISQLGGVRIGDRVDIGAGVTIDRGALDDTVIGDDVIIDDQVHIAHNCRIGDRTALAGCVGIAGSVSIGADCTLAGQVGVSGHLQICDNVHFAGQARVTRSIDEPGSYSSGTPLEAKRAWGRNAVRFTQLDTLHRRVAALEAKLSDLESGVADAPILDGDGSADRDSGEGGGRGMRGKSIDGAAGEGCDTG
jgi:UDP-3-O-[3-hydroxymyristoyl] glucosamine N-acyltransferase